MSTPAGWYDDGSGRLRWWDGQEWTEHFAPEPPAVPEQAAPEQAAPAEPAATQNDLVGYEAAPSQEPDDFDLDATVLREDIPSISPYGDQPAAPSYDDTTAPAYDPPAASPPYGQPPVQAYGEQPAQAYPPSDFTAPGYTPAAGAGYPDMNATAAYPGGYPASVGQPHGAYAPVQPTGPQKPPILGFVGLGLAVVGTILACIPGIPVIGWIVLFAAFVVSVTAIFQKNTKKWPSITGLILSFVGAIIGAVVFVFMYLLLFAPAFDSMPSSDSPGFSEFVETDEPTDPEDEAEGDVDTGAEAGLGRPSPAEIEVGLTAYLDRIGSLEDVTEEDITCYAQYVADSDLSDEVLWEVIDTDILTSKSAGEFTVVFIESLGACL